MIALRLRILHIVQILGYMSNCKVFMEKQLQNSPGVLSNKIHIWKTLLVSKLKYFEAIGKKCF